MSVATTKASDVAGDTSHRLNRHVGRTALLFTSVGSVIGSGWLLGALNATKEAGPAAIISWIVGAGAVMLLAFVHAELGGMSPVGGGNARFPHFAFGSLFGFGMGWVYWLGSVTLAPVEVEAALQYADKYINDAVSFHVVQTKAGETVLTAPGIAVGAVLMLGFTLLNLYGVSRLTKANSAIVTWKIAVPFLAIIVLMITQFKTSNFTAGDGFAPAGAKGILSAIATGGVLFAYQGFEQAIQFGGETSNPRRNIPFAVIGSMVLGTIMYILLQLAFVGALDPKDAAHGWAKLSFTNDVGPFAGIATALGLGWLATILYADAVVSPAGTGLVYTGSSARISYALGRNGYIPHAFDKLNDRKVPWFSVVFAFAVGMIMFLPFPGWQKLAAFITSASLVIYAAQCVSVAALRKQLPDVERPIRIPALNVLAPVSFVIANEIVLFAGWSTDWKLLASIGIGFILLAISIATRSADERPDLDWHSGLWMAPWLIGLVAISYFSSFAGGTNKLHFGVDMIVTAVFAAIIYYVALNFRLSPEDAREHFDETAEEASSEA